MNTSNNSTMEIVALEDFSIFGGKVKCYIPNLTPYLSKGEPKDENVRVNKSNMLTNVNVGSFKVSNYVSVYIPKTFAYESLGKKGEKFLATFINGDVNRINIIGQVD